jgi:hypothetical protein
VTASLHCLDQARYELREVTRELQEGKGKDEKGPSYPDHGGLELR